MVYLYNEILFIIHTFNIFKYYSYLYNEILYCCIKKEWGTDVLDNIDEPWKHCATWKKKDQSQKTTYYVIPLTWKFRIGKSMETEC